MFKESDRKLARNIGLGVACGVVVGSYLWNKFHSEQKIKSRVPRALAAISASLPMTVAENLVNRSKDSKLPDPIQIPTTFQYSQISPNPTNYVEYPILQADETKNERPLSKSLSDRINRVKDLLPTKGQFALASAYSTLAVATAKMAEYQITEPSELPQMAAFFGAISAVSALGSIRNFIRRA